MVLVQVALLEPVGHLALLGWDGVKDWLAQASRDLPEVPPQSSGRASTWAGGHCLSGQGTPGL